MKLLGFDTYVTTACAKRAGAAAGVECRQREPARAISPGGLCVAAAAMFAHACTPAFENVY